jgi:hypothetical protein
VAKQLIATAKTADHDFAIWAINPPFSANPYTFDIASWSIDYRALDSNKPGFLPSVCTFQALINNNDLTTNLRSILQDATGMYFVKITKGIDVVYVGFITPDLGEIELINGQRFIKFVASDGFQMLDKTSSLYEFTGAKPFTTQIYEIFKLFDFWEIYDAYAISQHPIPNQVTALHGDTEGGMYWTGCIQEGLYYTGTSWRNFRDVMDDILVTFGLQCFQDRGLLVFRSAYYETPDWYNFYGYQGAFLYRLTGYSVTDTAEVFSDGLELFKPATRQIYITHNQPSSAIIKDEVTQYKSRSNYYVGNAVPTGTNKLQYNAAWKVRATVPDGYPLQNVEFTITAQIRYGAYYYNGTAWTKTASNAISVTKHKNVQNNSGNPAIEDFTHTVANFHTAALPNIGTQPIYVSVEATQTAGDDLDGFATSSTLVMEYHTGTPTTTEYYADNTKKRNGVDLSFKTEIGDIFQSSNTATPIAGELRYFINRVSGLTGTNLQWDAAENLLLTIISIELAKTAFKPPQYYEIELTKPISYNHKFTFGSVDYKPLNLSFNEKTTTVTYKEWVYGSLITDPNNGRPDQLLPPL